MEFFSALACNEFFNAFDYSESCDSKFHISCHIMPYVKSHRHIMCTFDGYLAMSWCWSVCFNTAFHYHSNIRYHCIWLFHSLLFNLVYTLVSYLHTTVYICLYRYICLYSHVVDLTCRYIIYGCVSKLRTVKSLFPSKNPTFFGSPNFETIHALMSIYIYLCNKMLYMYYLI